MGHQENQERSTADWLEFYNKHAQHPSNTLPATDGHVVFRHYRAEFLLNLLLATVKTFNVTSVLDVGSEEGFISARLSQEGLDVTALDLSMRRLQDMRTREQLENVELIQGDGSHLPFANNSHEMVLVMDVIEHIPDFDLAVAESIRVAKKCWIFSTNTHGLHRRIISALGRKDIVERADLRVGHLHVFTYSNLKKKLQSCADELNITEEKSLFSTPPLVSVLTLNGLLRGSFVPIWLNLFNAALPRISKNWFANWIVLVASKDEGQS